MTKRDRRPYRLKSDCAYAEHTSEVWYYRAGVMRHIYVELRDANGNYVNTAHFRVRVPRTKSKA